MYVRNCIFTNSLLIAIFHSVEPFSNKVDIIALPFFFLTFIYLFIFIYEYLRGNILWILVKINVGK